MWSAVPKNWYVWEVKCAGMPSKCKLLFLLSMLSKSDNKNYLYELVQMLGYERTVVDNFTPADYEFIRTKRRLTDFKVGLAVPGKLLPKRIRGGIVLMDTVYQMR